jgi:hypothetical protein
MTDALRGNTIIEELKIGASATDADLAHLVATMPLCCVDTICLPTEYWKQGRWKDGHLIKEGWDDAHIMMYSQLSNLAFDNFAKRIAANDPDVTEIGVSSGRG